VPPRPSIAAWQAYCPAAPRHGADATDRRARLGPTPPRPLQSSALATSTSHRPCRIATESSSMRDRSSCCTVSIIRGPVAQQVIPSLVAEDRADSHPDADVVGGRRRRVRCSPVDRHPIRRPPTAAACFSVHGGAVGLRADGVTCTAFPHVDLTPLQVVGQGSRGKRTRVEHVAIRRPASTGSGSGARATHPRTATIPASARQRCGHVSRHPGSARPARS